VSESWTFGPPAQRKAGYEESWDLTYRVEQLRELVGQALDLDRALSEELDHALARLVQRNQRLRSLLRMVGAEREPEDLAVHRSVLEDLDQQLLRDLPGLLDRLRATLL
jgi:vacuolar-type H+-ATPase catalytic subunit A/Vma1